MTQRLFVASDAHLDWTTDGYERFDDGRFALMQIHDQTKPGDIFCFAGDLANPDSRGVHRAVGFATKFAAMLKYRYVHQLWLTGNHDVVEDGHGTHTLMALESLTIREFTDSCDFVLADEPGRYRVGGHEFLALPFTPRSHDYSPEEMVRRFAGYPDTTAVIGHLSLPGITPGSETDAMPRGRNVVFPIDQAKRLPGKPLLINGHYHERQVFNGVHVPGSLFRCTHAEEKNTPGFLCFDLPPAV